MESVFLVEKESVPLGFVLLNLDGKSLPEAIICTLSEGHPLSARELFIILSRQTKRDFTYQAVHKAVSTLSEKNILSKKTNKYLLSEKFILKLAQYSDFLQTRYKLESKKIDSDKNCPHPIVFHLFNEIRKQNSLLERTLDSSSAKEFFP